MNKLLVNHKYIEVQCARGDAETLRLISEIPYHHSNRIKTKFRTSIRNVDKVLHLFRGIDSSNLDKAPLKVQEVYNAEMQRRRNTEFLLKNGNQREPGWLFAHQQLGRELAEVNNKFAFFYDTRTGKTPMSLQIIVDDIKKNPGHSWLVLCPLILIENAWLEDIKTFFPELDFVNLHHKDKTKRLRNFEKKSSLYISNIESFINYREHIEKLPIHGCFVDESSSMKSQKSKFGKAAVEYANKLERWYLLSGAPAPNGEWEYYRQLQSVDPYGVHQSWTQFKQHFFVNVSYSAQFEKLQTRGDRKDELMGLLRQYSLYVDKEDVLNTPGRDFIPVEVTMPSELREQYDQLRRELFLELKDVGTITAPSAAAKINKLNQVTSGFIIDTKQQQTHLISDYKFKALDNLLTKIGDEQAIIWCIYRKEFEVLKKRLNSCACVYGDVSAAEKTENIRAFKDGKVQYLIANPASADKGLTLTNAKYAIYFSLSHSYELWKQSTERIYGDISKQKHRCTYYILMTKGTVDKAIYNAVQNKGDMSMEILEHLKTGGDDDAY